MLLAWMVVHFAQVVGAMAAVLFFVLGIRRYVRARARFRSKPWCLRCRYACHDLPDPRCPECGRAVASRLDLPRWCRWDGWTSLILAAALIAAIGAARNPRIDRLYHMLPDRTLAAVQADGGRLAGALLPEFDRRLVRQHGHNLASLTVSSWLKRMHGVTPIAQAQLIDEGNLTRIGFRKLSPAPDAVMRASELVLQIQIRQHGSISALLSADLHELLGVPRTIFDTTNAMACDVSADIPGDFDIELVLSNEPRLTERIGGLLLIQQGEPATTQQEPSVRKDVFVYPVMDGGHIATVSGAPTGSPGSEAFDLVAPRWNDDERRLRFLGWEWLSNGVTTSTRYRGDALAIEIVIRR